MIADIIVVDKRRVVAVKGTEELAVLILCSTYLTDRQAVLDSYLTTIVVAYETTEGTAAGIFVEVDNFTIKQTVGNINKVYIAIVHIAHDTTVVTAAACVITVQCTRVDTVLDGSPKTVDINRGAAQNTTLSAASQCVIDIHIAVDVADGRIIIAGISCNTTVYWKFVLYIP